MTAAADKEHIVLLCNHIYYIAIAGYDSTSQSMFSRSCKDDVKTSSLASRTPILQYFNLTSFKIFLRMLTLVQHQPYLTYIHHHQPILWAALLLQVLQHVETYSDVQKLKVRFFFYTP